LSGRGLCDELITRPEESYRLCCVAVCDLETSRLGAPYIYIYIYIYIYDISRLRVNHRAEYMGFVLEKVAVWQIVYRILQFPPLSEIPTVLRDHVVFTYHRRYSVAILPTDSVLK